MKHLLLSLILTLLLVGCRQNEKIYKIQDVSQESEIILQSLDKEISVVSIQINVFSRIEGEADIQLLLNDSVYKTERIKGNSKVSLGGDWYSEVVKIKCIPQDKVSGEVIIKYKFITI